MYRSVSDVEDGRLTTFDLTEILKQLVKSPIETLR